MSMDEGLARGFDTLSRYFMMRLERGMQRQDQQEDDDRKRSLWREEQAAIGETGRGVRQEIVGGNVFEVDAGKRWDEKAGKWAPVEYGRRLAPPAKAEKGDFVKIVNADGSHAEHRRGEPLPEGAKFYEREAKGGAKEPKWREVDDGNGGTRFVDERTTDLRSVTPKRSGEPPKPESPMHDGRSKRGNYSLEQGEPVLDKDGQVIGAPAFVMPSASRAAQAGAQLSPTAQQTLAEAQAAISAGADRAAVLAKLNPKDPDDAAVIAALRGQ